MVGAAIPRSFFERNEHGIIGGIEYGFTSTTPYRNVALGYAQGTASTLMEARMGMVNRGADISWLSQFPHAYLAGSEKLPCTLGNCRSDEAELQPNGKFQASALLALRRVRCFSRRRLG